MKETYVILSYVIPEVCQNSFSKITCMIMEYNRKKREKRQFYLTESVKNFINFRTSLLPHQFHGFMQIFKQKSFKQKFLSKAPFNLSFP